MNALYRAALGTTALVALVACAAAPTVVHQRVYVRQQIPTSLLTCAAWPVPETTPADVKGLAAWLARAHAAHADCAGRLGEVRELVEAGATASAGGRPRRR